MRLALTLRLLAVATLSGFDWALGAPPTTITPNGLGTSVASPTAGFYNIQGGTTAGSNLFHSFSTFNVGTGDTADFNVTSGITNILARVTGGPSTIDGTITSTIGAGGPLSSANLFLINPAGVMFTANAQVNLGGSFIVSTANYVKFSDGSFFYGDVTHPIQDAGLTSAPVSAFGFLTATPQPISFLGSQITMQPGTGLHLIGGDVKIDQGSPDGVNEQGAFLYAPSCNVSIFSAAGAGEVPFSLALPGSGYANATTTSFGNVTIQNQSSVAIDGSGGGSVVIRGGKMVIDNSSITSTNSGAIAGGSISVQTDQLSVRNGGFINSDTYGASSAGSVTVNVTDALSISGTGSQISANTESSGAGGEVRVMAGSGSVDLNGGDILANNDSSGQGGNVTVSAGSMSMEGNARLSSVSDGTEGNAGMVTLTLAGPLTMTDTAAIVADTYTSGNGGNINVTAGQIRMTGQSLISANTVLSSGSGGNITVQAGSLSIRGSSSEPLGSVGILAQNLNIGTAGTISVTAGAFSLDQNAVISSASTGSSGDAGSVSVNCTQGELSGQSEISASSNFTNAGSVEITAANSFTLSSGSSVSTSAGLSGGNINLKVGRLLYLLDSNIQAYAGVANPAEGFVLTPAQEAGITGGNINIDPEFVVLQNSLISANDLSPGGANGNIVNSAEFFFTNDSLLHATGTIDTTPPDLDLASSLAPLSGNLVDAQNKLRESCARSINHEFSSLIVVGRGGTETDPNELRSDFGMSLRP